MHQARILFFVVSPFDLPAFRGGGVTCVAQVGGVALIAQERIADFFTGTGKFFVGSKKAERMIDRHDRQVFAGHLRDKPTPQPRTHDDVVRAYRAPCGMHRVYPAVGDIKARRRRVLKDLKFAGCFRLVHKFAGDGL